MPQKETTESANIDFLELLERRVKEAADRISALRAENRDLSARVAELELELEAADEATVAAPDADALEAERQAWLDEKDEIRRRVEALAEHLEDLLVESEDELEGEASDDDE
jgi:FtsZ-binding cell division protein ZapB